MALSGEGGDEIFCGYPRYWSDIGARANSLNRLLASRLPPLSRFGQSMQRHAYVGLAGYAAALGGMTAVQIETLLTPAWRETDYDYLWFYRRFWREELDPLSQLRWLDLTPTSPEGLLTKVDRTSMAHSLEVRPPLLDHRLVEFMLSVDPGLLVDRAQAARQTPGAPLDGAAPAARVIWTGPKSGFGLPVRSWIKRNPQLLTRRCGG